MMHLIRRSSAALLGIAISLSTSGVYAQDQSLVIEEIVVTAQKREQSLQDVPISISVLSGNKLQEAGIDNLDDLAPYVPNFSKGESGGGAILQMRGIGTGSNVGFEQSVVMYMDDISLSRGPLARMPLMDLERVEVLRGPQNVLFGKNSIGGAISLVTAKPTDEVEGSVSLTYEPDYEDTEVIAILSGPLSDRLSGRLAVRYADYGGYYENSSNGDDEESREETAIRGTLRWDAGDDAEVIVKLEHNTVDGDGQSQELIFGYDTLIPGLDGLDYTETVAAIQAGYNFAIGQFGLPPVDVGSDEISQDRVRGSAFNAFQDLDLNKVQVTYNQEFDNFTFTSLTGYVGYEQDRLTGGAFSGIDISSVLQNEDYDQISQEFRFTSTSDGPYQWIAGGFFQTWELDSTAATLVDDMNMPVLLGLAGFAPDLDEVANLASTGTYSADSATYAAFGQFTWNVSDAARITLGGRYTYEIKNGRRFADIVNTLSGEFELVQAIVASCGFRVDYNTLGVISSFVPLPNCDGVSPAIGNYSTHDVNDRRTEDAFTPSLTGELDIGDSHMAYATVSQGFKAGGFDALGLREKDFEYDDEEVIGYEVGLKSSFADGRAQTSIAYFDTDYDDLQVSTFDGTAGFFVGNAAEYSAKGVEADGRWRVTDSLTLAGSFSYIDAEFTDYDNATCNARESLLTGATVCSRTGTTPSNTPEWSGNLTADLVLPVSGDMEFRATLDVNYEDEYFTEPTKEVGTIQDSYTKYNLRLALEAENWTVAVLGKNLSDEDVPPRTIAAQFDYRF
jgi:outer membrane receptor protein involved in Fe transport